MDNIMSMIESTTMQIAAFLVLGVVLSILYYAKGIPSRLWNKMKLPQYIEATSEVVQALAELRTLVGAARAYVFQFHNGSCYSNGSSILRKTCTHESVAPGISQIAPHCSNILVSTVPEGVDFLIHNMRTDRPVYTETNDIDMGFYRNILTSNGVEGTIKYPLYRNNDVIGYVGVDFTDTRQKAREADANEEQAYMAEIDEKIKQVATSAAQVEYWVNIGGRARTRIPFLG